jgi:hypothetical protein
MKPTAQFRNKLGVFATASAVAYLFLVRAMPRGLQFSIFVILGVALSAFTPGTDHNLMNASSGPIVLDIRSSCDQSITHFRLTPGHSVGFNGVFQHLRVRMVSGKMLTFSERQLIELHGDSVPTRGDWLVEDSGVRSVSSRDYNLAYRRFHKLWP